MDNIINAYELPHEINKANSRGRQKAALLYCLRLFLALGSREKSNG